MLLDSNSFTFISFQIITSSPISALTVFSRNLKNKTPSINNNPVTFLVSINSLRMLEKLDCRVCVLTIVGVHFQYM